MISQHAEKSIKLVSYWLHYLECISCTHNPANITVINVQSIHALHDAEEHYEEVTLTEFHPRHNNKLSNLLAFALDVHMHKTTIKLQIAANGKTYGFLLFNNQTG